MTTLQEEKLGLYRRNCELRYVSDYHFLMHLLPYMQQISPDRKVYVRLKLPIFLMRKKIPEACQFGNFFSDQITITTLSITRYFLLFGGVGLDPH
jgi:hypothetical protein